MKMKASPIEGQSLTELIACMAMRACEFSDTMAPGQH